MQRKQSINSDRLCWPISKSRKSREMFISIQRPFSGWPEAKFLGKPTTERVIEFLKNYIDRHGIPEVIRTNPGSIFKSKSFKEFGKRRLIQHVECPIRRHRGNGKIKRLIITINERLRTTKQKLLKPDNSGLSEILVALRMCPTINGETPMRDTQVKSQIQQKG